VEMFNTFVVVYPEIDLLPHTMYEFNTKAQKPSILEEENTEHFIVVFL